MNRALSLLARLTVMAVLTLGSYTPGQAAPQTAIMPPATINIAHFFKPPNGMDAATAARNFNTIILTNGDHVYRDQLAASGFTSTVPEYFRADGIQNPGSCTATPTNNQVAYHAGDFCYISANHPDWFLLDSRGRRITVTSSGEYYRMDPANPGWREFFLTRVMESQNQNGWSGLFLDNVEGGLGKFYGPQSVKYPDHASYQNAVAGFLQYLYVNYSQRYGRPVIGNIVARADDVVWFTYLQFLDGAMQERFAVDWDETSYLTPERWQKDLDFFERTQAQGRYVILVAPGNQNDLQRQNFAFASYLLINNGKAAFRYSTDDAYRDVWLYENYKLNLGSPLGPRYISGNVWRRDFTNGCVAVDPVNHSARITATTSVVANVYIRNSSMGGCFDTSGQSQRVEYTGVDNGPVRVVSAGGSPIIASERINLKRNSAYSSYAEVMGMPASKLTDTYYFPWYNNTGATDSQLRIGNVGGTATTVTVRVGGVAQGSPRTLAPSESARLSLRDVNGGPVEVKSSGGVPIIAALRVNLKANDAFSSYSEFLGLPAGSAGSTRYMFPWYNNTGLLDTQLRLGNVGSSNAAVTVRIGGATRGGPYSLALNKSMQVSFNSLDSGPVEVTSTNGVPIVASVRISLKRNAVYSSYTELMGQPGTMADTRYLFPWYNNTGLLDSQLRFGNVGSAATTVTVRIGGAVVGRYNLGAGESLRASFPNVDSGPVEVFSSGGVPIIAAQRINLRTNAAFTSYFEFMGGLGRCPAGIAGQPAEHRLPVPLVQQHRPAEFPAALRSAISLVRSGSFFFMKSQW